MNSIQRLAPMEAMEAAYCGAAILVARADKLSEAEVDCLIDAVRALVDRTTSGSKTAASTAQLMDWCREAQTTLAVHGHGALLSHLRRAISTDAAHDVVRLATRVSSADGPFDGREREALSMLGQALGLSSAHIELNARFSLARKAPTDAAMLEAFKALEGWTVQPGAARVASATTSRGAVSARLALTPEEHTLELKLSEGAAVAPELVVAWGPSGTALLRAITGNIPTTLTGFDGLVAVMAPQAIAVFERRGPFIVPWERHTS